MSTSPIHTIKQQMRNLPDNFPVTVLSYEVLQEFILEFFSF